MAARGRSIGNIVLAAMGPAMKLHSGMASVALAGALIAGGPGAAGADDMSGKKALPLAAVVHNWGGLYGGVNAGWIGADINSRFPPDFPLFQFIGAHDSGVVGAHVGLQHQFGSFVLGVEAALSGTGAFGHWGSSKRSGTPDCVEAVIPTLKCQSRIDGMFTVGPRLGFASNRWLVFVGGGYASARLEDRLVYILTGIEALRSTGRHDGRFLGGGVEYALTGNWIVGVEYQHLNLNTKLHMDLVKPDPETIRLPDARADIVRARLSYTIGWPEGTPRK